jgi:hypothetical protein
MKERTLKSLAFTFSAFSVISSAAQILALAMPYRIGTFALTLACALCALLFFRRAKAHHNAVFALEKILKHVPTDRRFAVRRIVDEAQLRELWEIDTDSYGDAAISLETFHTWWKRYPYGLFGLFEGEEIIGGFGMWPLSTKVYKDGSSGILVAKGRDPALRSGSRWRGRSWFCCGIRVRCT